MKKTFGKSLKAQRQEIGVTLQAVADEYGCSRQYIHQVESGFHISQSTYEKIMDLMKNKIVIDKTKPC